MVPLRPCDQHLSKDAVATKGGNVKISMLHGTRHLLVVLALANTPWAYAEPEKAEELVGTALDLDANADHGRVLFAAQCAPCHGNNAQGDAGKVIPSLAGQRRSYLVKQFADFSEHDRTATRMHAVVARPDVSEPQAWADLASYLNSLPPLPVPQTGSGKLTSLGEASYRQWCSSCHEEDARGDDEGFVPALRNQHYSYLLGEIRGIAEGHRFNVEPDLVRFLTSLDAEEMQGLADYLSRKGGPVRDRARLLNDGSISR